MITGKQVAEAMEAANIQYVDHHPCGFCGYMTRFVRVGNVLFFDIGCHCTYRGETLEPRPFDDVANWINMQSEPEIRTRLAASFGIQIEA